jgi:hypothetical protein
MATLLFKFNNVGINMRTIYKMRPSLQFLSPPASIILLPGDPKLSHSAQSDLCPPPFSA